MSYSPRHDSGGSHGSQPQEDIARRKAVTIAIIAALLVAAAVALVFIIISATGGKQTETNRVVHTTGNRHDVTVAADGGASAGELEGLWKIDDITSYEFDGKGRGIIHTAEGFPFSYSAENGVLYIDIDTDDAHDSRYEYTIDGLTLTLVRGDSTYVFTKVI